MTKQHHIIEIFSANYLLCKSHRQVIYDVNNMTEGPKIKMRDCGVKAVPTAIIDGNIRAVGISDFPWISGDDLYSKLKEQCSFKKSSSIHY